MTTISPLRASDRSEWGALWEQYLAFYESTVDAAVTDAVFARLVAGTDLHGALARTGDGRAVGFVHWLFHPATWTMSDYCYLEDLFVTPDVRGGGVGSALISHVRAAATDAGAHKVYWLTQSGNATARRLYDSLATDTGFVHYQMEL